jgi:hypothetical protein
MRTNDDLACFDLPSSWAGRMLEAANGNEREGAYIALSGTT